jgi:excisionase family DNA binding protein
MSRQKPPASDSRKASYSTKEAARELSVSLPQLYVLLGQKKLQAKKLGKKTVLLAGEIDRYLGSLPDAIINPQRKPKRAEEARAAAHP